MRALTLLHRWLAVPLAPLFAMWFASGVVMHFVPYPALSEAEPGPKGTDRVEFEVSTNPGAPFGALTRIASGLRSTGLRRSRLMIVRRWFSAQRPRARSAAMTCL